MNNFIPKPSDSQLTTLSTKSYEIQPFIEEFQNNPHNSKTLTMIEDNFIKKFRFKNSLPHISGQSNYLAQFIDNFKQTLKLYQNYHSYLQSTLDKYNFCRELKKFYHDLNRSENKSMTFFLNQIEFHKAFVQENQLKYQEKLSEIKQVCVNCKENYNKKMFENIKQNVVYPFSDPFKIYKKHNFGQIDIQHQRLERFSDEKSQMINQNMFKMGLEQIELAQEKMRSLIKQSKSISGNALEDIFDMFENKQQLEMESVNKVRINEMFYDLQNDLNLRSNFIEEYIDELTSFNDRLVNYNPNQTNRMDASEQKQPDIIEKELKLNFKKIVKKIYTKVTELIKKRKDESISVECQVNFSQQNVLRQLEKQKKKLALELKQCQQQKKSTMSNLNTENERISKQLKQANEQRIKADMTKNQALTDKNNAQKQSDKLIKVVSQMKKEIQRLTYVLEKQKRSSRFAKTDFRGVDKKQSRFNQDSSNVKFKEGKLFQKSVGYKENQSPGKPIQSGPSLKSKKNLDNQMIEELEISQIQLIKMLENKQLQNRKKFIQPRRSKLSDNITVEESTLSKQIKRMSNFLAENTQKQNQNKSKYSHSSDKSSQSKSNSSSLQDFQQIEKSQHQKSHLSKDPTQKSKTVQKSQKSLEASKQLPLKNHKSKTFTRFNQKAQQQGDEHGKSSRQISQTSQDIRLQLQELQKIKQMKQIEMKLASITKNARKNEPRKSLGFHIEKQVQQSVLSPNQGAVSKSILKNMQSSNLIKKSDLMKRFAKPSVANISNSSQGKMSIKNLPILSKEPRKSNVSISSQNYMNICDQIYKQIEENLCHVGTQASENYEQILQNLYELEIKNRKFNQMILTFDSFKFGYEEFLTQLMAIILKEQSNPVRRLNSYKGSSSVLKKNHNYRFTKENLLNRTWKESDVQKNLQNTQNKAFSKTIDERNYFVQKMHSEEKNYGLKMNQTMSNFAFNRPNMNNQSSQKLLNCVTIADFKNMAMRNQSSKQMQGTEGQGFIKKGYYTLHNVRTDGTEGLSEGENYQIKEQENDKLPMISEDVQRIVRLPSFQREAAESLFFSIESARVFEQKTSNSNTNQSSLMALEQHEIKFSTQILTALAHIHLNQPTVYQQIKQLLLHPAKVLIGNTNQIECGQNRQNEAELSLKKGLCLIIQLHRKCLAKGTSQQKLRKNVNVCKTEKKSHLTCTHLQKFKEKIVQVIKTKSLLSNTAKNQ